MVKSRENLLGAYAFLIGVVLAIVFGIFNDSLEGAGSMFYFTLILIGFIVGYMNTSEKDASTFLLASLSIVIVGALGVESLKYVPSTEFVVNALRSVLGTLSLLFIPATVVVALKTVFAMAKI